MNAKAQSPMRPSSPPSFTSAPATFIQRKCACGGSAGFSGECAECQKEKLVGDSASLIQPKLKISQPNDKYEQEADRVADEVMRMPKPKVQRQVGLEEEEDEETIQTKPIASKITPLVQRQVTDEEEGDEGEELIQAKIIGDRTLEMTPAISTGIKSMQGGGRPLSSSERNFFEPRFSRKLSDLSIHTSSSAAALSRQINAQAFTQRNHIFFAAGRYNSTTTEGRHLLAHELTHTIQQGVNPTVQRRFDAITSHSSGSVGRRNFADKNLVGKNFRRQDLRRANFSRSDLTGAKFNWSDLEEANFNGAILRNAKFVNAKLARATFREADMEEAKLRWADLFAADLAKAKLFRSNFRGATLLAANFRGANMIGVKLRGADLAGATLTSRDLLGADVRGAVGLSPTNGKFRAEDVIQANKQLLSTLAGEWIGEVDGTEGDILFTLRGGVGDMVGTFRSRRDARVFHLLVKAAPEGSRRHVLQWNDGFGGRGRGWLERSLGGDAIRGSIRTGRGSHIGADITLIRTTVNKRGEQNRSRPSQVQRKARPVHSTIQPKLKISQPNDKYEQEADRVADEVMRMPEPRVQRQVESEEEKEDETIQTKPLASKITPLVQRQVIDDEDEEQVQLKSRFKDREETPIQYKEANTSETQHPNLSRVPDAAQATGYPLDSSIRSFMEQRFGYDFSHVRIHTNTSAQVSARGINAQAYTTGHDIVFDSEKYMPETFTGQQLLAHELTHVVQQNAAINASKSFVNPPSPNIKFNTRNATALPNNNKFHAGQQSPIASLPVKHKIIARANNRNIIQRKPEDENTESVEELKARHLGVPSCGRECDPEIDPGRGDRLREVTGLAVRVVGGAINRLDRIEPHSGDRLFHAVFRTTPRETAPQIDPFKGPVRLKSFVQIVRKRFHDIIEELSSIKVSWGPTSILEPSTPFPGGPLGQPPDPCAITPTFQKYVCYKQDPFSCLFDEQGNQRQYSAFTEGKKGSDVHICKRFWNHVDLVGAGALIHEMAHNVPGMAADKDVYMHQDEFGSLSSDEAVKNPDSYVEFALLVHQGSLGEQELLSRRSGPANAVSLGAVRLPGAGAVEVTRQQNTKSCSPTQADQLPKIVLDARDLIARALPKIDPQHAECWFGSKDRFPRVIGTLNDVKAILFGGSLNWTCQGSEQRACKRGFDAFTAHDERGRVLNVCPRFFHRRDPATATIHELTHVLVGSLGEGGEKYDLKSLRKFACFYPEKALKNPENYVKMLLYADLGSRTCPPPPYVPESKAKTIRSIDKTEQRVDRAVNNNRQRPKPLKQRLIGPKEDNELYQMKEQKTEQQEIPSEKQSIIHNVLHTSGKPLDPVIRKNMELHFKHDFSDVRLHVNTKAAESAKYLNARALTVGQDVIFGAGQFSLGTAKGRKLLAHELAHVIQQRTNFEPKVQRKIDKISVDRCNFVIRMEIGIFGSLASVELAAKWQKWINTEWSKKVRCSDSRKNCPVNMVTVVNAHPDVKRRRQVPETNRVLVASPGFRSKAFGRWGKWAEDEDRLSIAHETGHLMGLIDRYWQVGARKTMRGFENDIMGDYYRDPGPTEFHGALARVLARRRIVCPCCRRQDSDGKLTKQLDALANESRKDTLDTDISPFKPLDPVVPELLDPLA